MNFAYRLNDFPVKVKENTKKVLQITGSFRDKSYSFSLLDRARPFYGFPIATIMARSAVTFNLDHGLDALEGPV
jgi:hypothetical protein